MRHVLRIWVIPVILLSTRFILATIALRLWMSTAGLVEAPIRVLLNFNEGGRSSHVLLRLLAAYQMRVAYVVVGVFGFVWNGRKSESVRGAHYDLGVVQVYR